MRNHDWKTNEPKSQHLQERKKWFRSTILEILKKIRWFSSWFKQLFTTIVSIFTKSIEIFRYRLLEVRVCNKRFYRPWWLVTKALDWKPNISWWKERLAYFGKEIQMGWQWIILVHKQRWYWKEIQDRLHSQSNLWIELIPDSSFLRTSRCISFICWNSSSFPWKYPEKALQKVLSSKTIEIYFWVERKIFRNSRFTH